MLDDFFAMLPQPWWAVYLLFHGILVGTYVAEQAMLRRVRAAMMKGHEDAIGCDDKSRVVLLVLGALIVGFSFRAGRWMETVPRTWSTVGIGVALALSGTGLRLLSLGALGANFRYISLMTDSHRLVTRGPYRFVRHPMYTGLFLLFTGLALIVCDLWIWLGFMAVLIFGAVRRIPLEEEMLKQQFADEFDAYRTKSWRLVPFLY